MCGFMLPITIVQCIHFRLPFIDPTILIVRGNGPIHHVQSSVNYQFTYNVMYDVKLVLRC